MAGRHCASELNPSFEGANQVKGVAIVKVGLWVSFDLQSNIGGIGALSFRHKARLGTCGSGTSSALLLSLFRSPSSSLPDPAQILSSSLPGTLTVISADRHCQFYPSTGGPGDGMFPLLRQDIPEVCHRRNSEVCMKHVNLLSSGLVDSTTTW